MEKNLLVQSSNVKRDVAKVSPSFNQTNISNLFLKTEIKKKSKSF